MSIILAIIFLYALFHGVRGAGRGVANAYNRKVDAWDAQHSDKPWAVRRGALLGYLFSMFKDGGPALLAGWREGWAYGKAKGEERWQASQPGPDAAQQEIDPNEEKEPGAIPTGGKPDLRLVKSPTTGDGPAPQTTQPPPGGSTPQPPPPPGGGANPNRGDIVEIVDAHTLLAAMQEKVRVAAIELEDSQAALARAEAEIPITQHHLAAMASSKFTAEDRAIVQALQDPEATLVAAAKGKVAAAAAMLAIAQRAVEMAAKHVQFQDAGAAGAAYGN